MNATLPARRPVIVVGVDGSPDSIRALRWAAEQARSSGARLRAVTGYRVPATIFFTPIYREEDYADEALELLEQSVREALGPEPDLEIEEELLQEPPSHALLEASGDAELLVVGGRGQGELFGEVHLGSVASYVLRHAPCTVVVVRENEGAETAA